MLTIGYLQNIMSNSRRNSCHVPSRRQCRLGWMRSSWWAAALMPVALPAITVQAFQLPTNSVSRQLTSTAAKISAPDKSAAAPETAGMFFATTQAAPPPPQQVQPEATIQVPPTTRSSSSSSNAKIAASAVVASSDAPEQSQQRRVLGSQENLMLPRQYAPGRTRFAQMNHVSVHVLSAPPAIAHLQQAVTDVMRTHPLLRAHVEGNGEPTRRIDLFQMVRSGEPQPCTFVTDDASSVDANRVLSVIDVDGGSNNRGEDDLTASWQASFARHLDNGDWCDVTTGPLWKMELHRSTNSNACAIVLAFNHAISDQSSANRLMDQILRHVAAIESGTDHKLSKPQVIPMALEDSVMGLHQRWSDIQGRGVTVGTLHYIANKAAEGFKSPVILPDRTAGHSTSGGMLAALSIIAGQTAGGHDTDVANRRSTVQFRTMSRAVVDRLLSQCRARNVTMSNALTAAATLTAADFVDGGQRKSNRERNYKILQSLDMRRYGQRLDHGATVACMAGSMDLMHGPLPDRSGQRLRESPAATNVDLFWKLAREGHDQTNDFVRTDGPVHAVRVFDFAMTISDLNNLVHLTAQSKDSLGRAYSAGVTNAGVYERQEAFELDGEPLRDTLQLQHGKYKIEKVYYATPHTSSGCLYQTSCMTVGGELMLTFHPVSPIVDEETGKAFADAFVSLLEVVAQAEVAEQDATTAGHRLPDNALPLLAGVLGAAAVGSHASAYSSFFQSLAEMKANTADPAQFWAALNFWIFFAVGHPILQPILWISDVLHGSPGPKIADLVPVTFLAGNAIVLGAVAVSKQIRNALNVAALAAFFAYVGAGLDGTAGLGDFNLALDDSYQGQIVKGCPTYDNIRRPSMDNFDVEKYQGKWYEQKFHDWTQFKEVYDTTLSIKLTADGKGWIDDFGVKGPAPDAAPLSWDKSPVANGAHYFLFGRIDANDPPGVLREKGFGVEFPNYIVDVQKDKATGAYNEAIQFQCLERGGVRVFEGINFMSRKEHMTDQELQAMHARAKDAGMYPYGASPEQMHTVARRPVGAPPVDNSWQAMWRAIGFDRLLEIITESIEDGGRTG